MPTYARCWQLFCVLISISAAAYAQPSAAGAPAQRTQVAVVLPACATQLFDAPSYVALLKVELAEDAVQSVVERALNAAAIPGALAEVATLQVEQATCGDKDTALVLHLTDPLTHKSSARGLDLGNTPPPARSRLLALASAELLRASWAELADMRRRAVIDAVTRLSPLSFRVEMRAPPTSALLPSALAKDRATEPPHNWSAMGALGVRSYANARSGMAGISAGAAYDAARLRVAAEAHLGFGAIGDLAGDVRTGNALLRLSVGPRWQAPGGFVFAVQPQLEAGMVWAGGSPAQTLGVVTEGHEGSAPVVLAGLNASLRTPLSPTTSVHVALEAGHSLVGFALSASDRPVSGVHGAYMGMLAGIAVAP